MELVESYRLSISSITPGLMTPYYMTQNLFLKNKSDPNRKKRRKRKSEYQKKNIKNKSYFQKIN
jgi:hypothetical protein